ncbi:MAG: helix-turn-helix domain-containing protein [Catonella sp.]
MDNLANRLKELRKLNNMTQKDVSLKLGITTRRYQALELNESLPKLSTLIYLADTFNVSLDFLVGRKGNFDDSLYKSKSDIL